jgi:hypothetical protein
MSIIGKILSAEQFKSQFTVKTKGVREGAYADLLVKLAALDVGAVYVATPEDISAGLGKAMPKHFKANMRKRLLEKFGKGAYEMVEATATGDTKVTYAFIKLPVPEPEKA